MDLGILVPWAIAIVDLSQIDFPAILILQIQYVSYLILNGILFGVYCTKLPIVLL